MIPIGTNNPLRHQPRANYILIGINVVLFLTPRIVEFFVRALGLNEGDTHDITAQGTTNLMRLFMLHSDRPQTHEFITYAFLHGDFMHLLGNMIFLFIFGNNVNDRLGHTGYLLLYLGGAVFSGVGHALFSQSPVLGASGAVAAVTGAYMVLFPKTYVHVLNLFIIITTFEIPAIYFILFKLIVWDNLLSPQMGGYSNIAYSAHLAGYFFGVAIPMTVLALKLLPHSHFDLWALTQRWRRQKKYQAVVNQGYNPYGADEAEKPSLFARPKAKPAAHPQAEQIEKLRAQISAAMVDADLNAAADAYRQLLAIDATQALPQQHLLDIANKLMQSNQHLAAAQAYELFLLHYSRYPFVEQIQLMLGLLYSRYLDKPELAKQNLQAALEKLTDASQTKMCQEELDRLP